MAINAKSQHLDARHTAKNTVEIRVSACLPVWALALFVFSAAEQSTEGAFELEKNAGKVECMQCVQLWRSAGVGGKNAPRPCGPHAPTCWGDACFMRQCKHCPVYQYMSGCVNLTPYQMDDLQAARRGHELRMRRVGAVLLCEDSFNQTTCVCNRRNKCNTLHTRLPYSTYAEGLFNGVINFDYVIGKIDPRYLEVITGFQSRFVSSSSSIHHPPYAIPLLTSIILPLFAVHSYLV